MNALYRMSASPPNGRSGRLRRPSDRRARCYAGPAMRSRLFVLPLLLAVGCASPPVTPTPIRASDFRPGDIRQPAVFVRVSFGPGEFSERERASLPAEYEGALLEELNTRAILARDVRITAEPARLDVRAALLRAREVQADHAILVDARVSRAMTVFCRETRRPVRGPATVWSQEVEVARVSDGALRLTLTRGAALEVTDVDADCGDPKQSQRRGAAETIAQAVRRLLARVLGP